MGRWCNQIIKDTCQSNKSIFNFPSFKPRHRFYFVPGNKNALPVPNGCLPFPAAPAPPERSGDPDGPLANRPRVPAESWVVSAGSFEWPRTGEYTNIRMPTCGKERFGLFISKPSTQRCLGTVNQNTRRPVFWTKTNIERKRH